MLADFISIIANRIVTPISSLANVELDVEKVLDAGRRYIGVLFVSEALRTNPRLSVVELSDVELEGDARIREAIRFPSVEEATGVYR